MTTVDIELNTVEEPVDGQFLQTGWEHSNTGCNHSTSGETAVFERPADFRPLQNALLALNHVRQDQTIQGANLMELCRLSEGQARDQFKRMNATGQLQLEGAGRGSVYRLKPPA